MRMTVSDGLAKAEVHLSHATALGELRAMSASHDTGSATAARITQWIATRYRRPLGRQVQLLQSLTRADIDYGPHRRRSKGRWA